MSLTKIGSIGINTGIQLAGVTTVSTLKVGSGVTLSSDGDIFATGVTTTGSLVSSGAISGTTGTFSDDVDLSADLNITGDNNKLRITSAIGNLGILSSTTQDITFDFFDNDTQTRLRTVDGRFQISADHRNEVADSQIRFIVDGTNQAAIDGDGHLYFRNDSDTYLHRPDTNTLAFDTQGAERLRIESGGNVGIGTSNANNLLHVYGGHIKAQTSTDDTDTDVDLIRAQCGSSGGALFAIRAADAADDNSDWDIKTNAGEDLSFTIGGSAEKARINSDGRLLIGSSSVRQVGGSANSGYFQIEGTSANTSSMSLVNNQNSTQAPVIRFGKTRGTSTGSVTTVADGDLLGRIAFAGADGTDLQNSTATIDVKVNGTVAGNQIPTDIAFETSATTGNARTERLRITSGGNIGINQSNPTAKLQVTGGGAYTGANSGRSVEGIDIQSSSGDVDGAFGGAISLGVGNVGRSAIVAVQNSDDDDNVGLAFFTHPSNTGAADAVEKVRITSAGAIGIGTVAPENDIQLVDDSATVKLTSTGSGNSTRLILESESDTYGGIHFGDPADEDAGRIRYYHGGSNPNHMSFWTNATEHMRLTTVGRLMLGGHTDPYNTGYKIDIQADTTNHLHGLSVRATELQNDTFCVAALAHATPSGASTNRRAHIGVYRNGSSQPGGYVYLHQQDGGHTYIWPDPSNVLRISNNLSNVTNASGTVVGAQTSDIRLKNVHGDVAYGLAEINKITPIEFNFKNDKNEKKRIGFSAQDLQSIIPESVYNTKDTAEVDGVELEDVLGMEYIQITPVLVNAVKELSTEIDKLKAEIAALKSS